MLCRLVFLSAAVCCGSLYHTVLGTYITPDEAAEKMLLSLYNAAHFD